MNVIWIVSDSLRRDHLGAYGNPVIWTPSLDTLAAQSIRFDRHYIASFPTMPTRADHFTGRWSMSFMQWEPLGPEVTTLAQIVAGAGFHTAAVVDTPFYLREEMNYDRGFQTFFSIEGQQSGSHVQLGEGKDVMAWWRKESDRFVARTMIRAGDWLERHYQEDFFLYVDTWDPHEPWDAPPYYTQMYLLEYDGEMVFPVYGHWQDMPGFTQDQLKKGHATYCGEVSLVDTWIGYLLRKVENMGLAGKTAIIFTSDHGFYFGEHGGLFGKLSWAKRPDGTLQRFTDPDRHWDFSPLYEEVTAIPLLIHVPGNGEGSYGGLTSAVDLMPTVLELLGHPIPDWVEGCSLMPTINDASMPGREFTVSTHPFFNVGDPSLAVDGLARRFKHGPVTTVTTAEWTLLYSDEPGRSELYHLGSDPGQDENLISGHQDIARELHQVLVRFMQETNVAPHRLSVRLELRL